MFKKNISKKAYNNIGISFIIIGLVFMGLSVFNFLNPEQSPDYEILRATSINECDEHVRTHSRLNFFSETDVENGEIIVYARNIRRASSKIYASSFIISQCEDFNISEYCFGQDCENEYIHNGGLFMKFNYAHNNKI